MTIGSVSNDGRYWVDNPTPGYGRAYIGPSSFKTWSGGDAISPSTPRSSFEKKKFRGRFVSRGPFLPPQNYSMRTFSQCTGWYWAKPNSEWVGMSAEPVSPPDISSIAAFDSSQEYKLISKLRDALYGSGFHPGVFTAEGRKTLSLISESAVRIGSALHRLKSGDPWGCAEALGVEPSKGFIRTVADARKGISRAWLEIQYGWKPLLKDAEDGAQWIAETVHGSTPVKVVRTRSWAQTSVTSAAQAGYYLGARSDIFNLRFQVSEIAKSSVALPSFYSVAGIAWELVPYSFVFDWFVPLGSYLEALRTANDIEGTVIRSLKQTTIWHDLVDGSGWSTQTQSPIFGPQTSRKETNFNRSVSTGLWVPPPISEQSLARLPEYRSWQHAVNAVALLAVGDIRRLSMIRT